MEKTTTTPQPVCAQESLALLNCIASAPYDRDRCLALVDALRECIVHKREMHIRRDAYSLGVHPPFYNFQY
ncbi:hypothetical protein SORBI_3006G275200 [Sorghum bicolor]|uniref:CHCH domain-containing protein n=1 Tax=Sorghum bicolor TaxID=4558 RepID=A0A1Z5RFY9_SORBI|nr:hypothetical protein SORBI_3006G275200 [Sorghum bicolor]